MANPKYDSLVDFDGLVLFKDKQDAYNEAKFAVKGVTALAELDQSAGVKLAGVEEGAQANVVERVTVGGLERVPVNKVVALGSAAGADSEAVLTNGSNLPTGSAVAAFVEGKGYQTAADVAAAIGSAAATAVDYKGSVAAFADLPAQGVKAGDMYNVSGSDMNYVWNGSGWDQMAPFFDATGLAHEADFSVATNDQINALFDAPGE